MRYLEGQVDDHEISIAIDDERKTCLLRVRLVEPWDIVQIDDEYPNARMLSSDLACQIGYGPACDFLHAHEVPMDSALWFLNHEGWSPPVADRVAKVRIGAIEAVPANSPLP